MRALTVRPGTADSLQLEDVPEPDRASGRVLVRALALGICGTDREIVEGKFGTAPPGQSRLVLGHESLGRVQESPTDSGLAVGDLVVGVVRQPDPEPCVNCAAGEWDMCRNGRYTEHGIKERDGFGAELWRIDPAFAIKIDPALGHLGVLLEPASVGGGREDARRRRRLESDDRARERGRVRIGERQSATLRGCRRRTGSRRPELARTAGDAASAAVTLARGARVATRRREDNPRLHLGRLTMPSRIEDYAIIGDSATAA